MKQIFFPIVLIITLAALSIRFAQADDSPQCGVNCQVNFTTIQDLENIANEFFNNGQTPAIVVKDAETGVFTITLPNGKILSVVPTGLTLRYQNTVQQHTRETEEGHLHLRSQSGLEVQLRSQFHHQVQAMGEMLRLGWGNIGWLGDRFEIDSPSGERMCLQPDMEVTSGSATGVTGITIDTDGNPIIKYQDGIQQRLHSCAHDMAQLRDQVRSTLQLQLQTHIDGTVSVQLDGQQYRYRLAAALRSNGILDQPGFFTEQNRLRFRYRDGWEQEIISIP